MRFSKAAASGGRRLYQRHLGRHLALLHRTANQHDRLRGGAYHLFGIAAQGESDETAPSVRTHDDQISLPLPGLRQYQ